MTRKSSSSGNGHSGKSPKEKRWKEPENEAFRSLEELNQEFAKRKGAAFRSLGELTNQFQQQQRRPQMSEAREIERTPGTGVLNKAFGRGFGFITPDAKENCEEVFLHFSDVAPGSARDLGVGTKVEAISDTESKDESRCKREGACFEVGMHPLSRANAYNRDVMLAFFKAMVARPSSFDDVASIGISTVPAPPSRRPKDQEDPHLDDEHLIAKLEERLDKEGGADALNMETFGTCSGWSYEEALKANARLKISRDVEESTIGASSRQSPSQSEDYTDGSEDGRDRSLSAVEALSAADTWNWEAASMQAKAFDDQRQTWEEKMSVHSAGRATVQVFQ
jgi:cold shock CspA family protein